MDVFHCVKHLRTQRPHMVQSVVSPVMLLRTVYMHCIIKSGIISSVTATMPVSA